MQQSRVVCAEAAARQSGQLRAYWNDYDDSVRFARSSEPVAAGFFIANVLRAYHDAAGLDSASRSGASFERGCSIATGRPDLCRPGTTPMDIGEVKYDSTSGAEAAGRQMRVYMRAGGVQVGDFGTSGSVRVGLVDVNWRASGRSNGVYLYSFDAWDLAKLLAGVATGLEANRQARDQLFGPSGGAAVPAAVGGTRLIDVVTPFREVVVGGLGAGIVLGIVQAGTGGFSGTVGGVFGGGGKISFR